MKTTLSLYALLALALLTIIGCGHFDSPTASQPTTNDESSLWTPRAGDQIGGHDIPLVNPNYWESVFGTEVNPALNAQRTAVIGPLGGIISLGLHTLIVPPGAVDEEITFTLKNASPVALALDCGPSPFHFNVPLTLIMSFRGTQYQSVGSIVDATVNDLRIYYMTPDGDLEPQRCVVDPLTNTVTAEIDHFSRYILG
jgi:hypothetical protein